MLLLRIFLALIGVVALSAEASPAAQAGTNSVSVCQLKSAGGNIQHVIFLIFDNVHFLRDRPLREAPQ